jgi:class 3 adenylate cyclase
MRPELARLLAAFEGAGDDDAREAAEAEIWRRHGEDAAVFVLDFPGFTSGVAELGLVAYLSRLNRLLAAIDSVVLAHRGRTVKHEADNCFAVFAHPREAVQAAEDCLEMLGGLGASACIGIAYGPVLFVGDDYFGLPVNIASKLGEDTAEAGQILIDEKSDAMLPEEVRKRYARRFFKAHGVDAVAMTRFTSRDESDTA